MVSPLLLTDGPTRRATQLPFWLGLDAAVTGVNAAGYVVLAGPLEDVLGPAPSTLMAVGLGLLVFTAFVAAVTAPRWRTDGRVRVVVAINVAWTIASVATAIVAPVDLSAAGRIWVVAQASVVAAFAVMQRRSLAAP